MNETGESETGESKVKVTMLLFSLSACSYLDEEDGGREEHVRRQLGRVGAGRRGLQDDVPGDDDPGVGHMIERYVGHAPA